jgi:hypothetical protein
VQKTQNKPKKGAKTAFEWRRNPRIERRGLDEHQKGYTSVEFGRIYRLLAWRADAGLSPCLK